MADLSLIERALVYYGAHLPNHPRKWWLHDRIRHALGVKVDRDVEVVREGLRWSLNPADYEHEGFFWMGAKDRWDFHHLRSLLTPDCVFFDIGSNFGYYSLTVAKVLEHRCRIHAFEPTPTTFDRIQRHVEWNKMTDVIQVHPLALSDVSGTATLIQRADNSGASRLGDDAAGIPVEITTLDAFCAAHGIDRLDVVKIDVEGYEARVLNGGSESLTRFKPAIMIEFWTTGLDRAKSSVDEVAEVLRRLGYKLFKPSRDQLIPISDPPRSEIPENVFCFHPDRPFGAH